jgi:DNA helicase II / ATP-dependent DNA helicase PcrA
VIKRQLLPQRALAALKVFNDIIEDGRAILSGTYAERLEETVTAEVEDKPVWSRAARPRSPDDEDVDVPSVAGDTDFSPDNFSFDFGGDLGSADENSMEVPPVVEKANGLPGEEVEAGRLHDSRQDAGAPNAGAADAPAASTAGILKFLIDRTGYIKQLEDEDTPEAFSRVENLRELVNAAMDSRDRGETLDQFLDHAALVSDADAYDERAQITLMTLHAAKGLEFPLVFLGGLEEGLFPHSRTFLQPDDVEEERRLCYVGMTRAMDTLILTRAVYRRRYGTDLPEASIPSRFLEEIPVELMEDLGSSRRGRGGRVAAEDSPGLGYARANRQRPNGQTHEQESTHYAYEDEDQSAAWASQRKPRTPAASHSGKSYNSIENIADFFASRGKKFSVPKLPVEEPKGKKGFRPGQKVRHPKYGEGTVFQREGEGEDAKITVQFPRFGLKKLVEKYAQLEGVSS